MFDFITNDKIMIALLGVIAGALPKIYELIVDKRKTSEQLNFDLQKKLSEEAEEFRDVLRKDIDELKEEIEVLRKENGDLFKKIAEVERRNTSLRTENFLLKTTNDLNAKKTAEIEALVKNYEKKEEEIIDIITDSTASTAIPNIVKTITGDKKDDNK